MSISFRTAIGPVKMGNMLAELPLLQWVCIGPDPEIGRER